MGDLPRGLKCPYRTKLYNMAAGVILFDEVKRIVMQNPVIDIRSSLSVVDLQRKCHSVS